MSDELDLKHNRIKHEKCIVKYINITDDIPNKHLTALFMKKNNMLKNILEQFLEPKK